MSNPALFSPPDPRAVLRTVELPLALLGALLAHPVLLEVSDAVRHTEHTRGGWMAVAVCTALISVLHFRLSTRGKTPGSVFARSAVFGLVLGPLNSGLSLAAVVALQDGVEPGVLGAFFMGAIFGSVAGGCIGLLFGVAYSPLAIAASHHRERPTHSGPEKARALAGAMVIAAALVHHIRLPEDLAFQAVAAIAGAVMVGQAFYRLLSLELFLRAVRRGQKASWSLVEARDPGDVAGLSPIHGRGETDVILYRQTTDEGNGPYRMQSQWLPVARLA